MNIDLSGGPKVARNARQTERSVATGSRDANTADGRRVDDLCVIESERQLARRNRSDRTVFDQLAIVGLNTDQDRARGGRRVGFDSEAIHLRFASSAGQDSQEVGSWAEAGALKDFRQTGRARIGYRDDFAADAFDLKRKIPIDQCIDRRDLSTLRTDVVLKAFGDQRDSLELGTADREEKHIGVFASVDRKAIELVDPVAQKTEIGSLARRVVLLVGIPVESLGREDIVVLWPIISE